MNADASPRVTAVTVTYGDRAELCATTVRAALAAGARTCIVVTNGLTADVAARLERQLAEAPVSFLPLADNQGSAGGFAAGLRAASLEDTDLIWVLDDDNVAEEDALRVLLETRDRIAGTSGEPALLSFRPDDAPESRMRAGGDRDAVYGPPGSVLYFDVFSRGRRRGTGRPVPDDVEVPYGPYGGLLVSRAAVRAVDGPRVGFHLYEDDSEYTWRLGRAFGLHLVFASIVRDADGKWSGPAEEAIGPARLLRAADVRRRRFSVRNRVAFDVLRVRHEGGLPRFVVNAAVYALVLFALAIKERRPRALVDLLRYAAAGVRMGRRLP